MFDIGWSELLIIAVIAIIVVGPRDLPRMLRTLGQYTRKMRSMAGEFKSQFNEALEEADLADIKKDVESLRSMDPLKGVKDELSPFKDIGKDLENSIAAPTPVRGAETVQDETPPPDAVKSSEKPATTGTKRKSSPRSVAQTTGSASGRAKAAKSGNARTSAKGTAAKPGANTAKPSRRKSDKPAKGEAG